MTYHRICDKGNTMGAIKGLLTLPDHGAYERGVQPVHRSVAQRAKKGPVNLWSASYIALAIDVLFYFFFSFVYFELFLIYLEK
jgi:hypothetical protein